MARPSRLAIIIAAFALLSACTTWNPETQPKQTFRHGARAIGGGLLGSQIGGGRGKLAATAAGTLLGAWVGGEVGASLEPAGSALSAAGHLQRARRQPDRHRFDLEQSR